MSKTTALLEQAQPMYASMREQVSPRIARTREVAVPMAVDMSHKAWDMTNRVRGEYLPEAAKRATLAAAVLRGAEMEQARERRSKWRLLAVCTAAGAVLGAGVYLWQHGKQNDDWYEEDLSEQPAAQADTRADDPANADIS